MRCAQFLAAAGLAGFVAAQSTTVVVTDGMTATIVLPEWNPDEDGGDGADGGATATLIVPPEEETETITADGEETATVIVPPEEETETVTADEEDTATVTPTSLVTTVTTVPEETEDAEPPVVTANAAAGLEVESLGGLLAFVAAGVAML